jgi:hypothetical protein
MSMNLRQGESDKENLLLVVQFIVLTRKKHFSLISEIFELWQLLSDSRNDR